MVCKDRKKLKIEREKEKSMDRSLPFYQDSWGIGLMGPVANGKRGLQKWQFGFLYTYFYEAFLSFKVCLSFLEDGVIVDRRIPSLILQG